MKLINADELELDTEWSEYYDGFTSYSQSQIDEAEEVKAIPLERLMQAREKIKKAIGAPICGEYVRRGHDMGLRDALGIIDKLIEREEIGGIGWKES